MDISRLAIVSGSTVHGQDLLANSLVMLSVKVGGGTPVELTSAILTNLINLQNGTDFSSGTNSHTHNGIYFTKTQIGSSTGGSAGSTLIGDDNSYTHFTPASATVKAALTAIDTALGTATGATQLDGTFKIENTTDITKILKFDASGITTGNTRTLKMADANVDLANLTNSNISSSAAIALTKLAALSNNFVLVSNGSGVISISAVTSTTLAFLDATSSVQTQLNATEKTANKGVANGYAPLDSGGKVPAANLPSTIMDYKGAWNASTNSPTLADGTGTNGDVYRASVAGTQNLGSGSFTYAVGDLVIYNGTIWQHSPAADGVSSVNGNTGAVTVNAINQLTGDVTAGPASGSASAAATIAAGAVTPTKLGSVTDGVTLDQSGSGSTIEIKALGVGTAQIAAAAVTTAKLGAVTDSVTTNQLGSSNSIQVIQAPSVQFIATAGQSFSANTTYAVRWGLVANGETAGRVYAADITTSSFDLFYVIGMASSAGAVTAGQTIVVQRLGPINLRSGDTAFVTNDPGKAVYLTASGTFSTTPPSTAGQAITRIGIVQVQSATVALNIVDVNPTPVGVN